MASARPASPYRCLTSAGSGSSPTSSVSSTVWIDRPITHELTLALAGYTGIISAANSAASSAETGFRSAETGFRSEPGAAPGSISYSGWISWSRPRKLDTVPANMPTMPGASRLKAYCDRGVRKKNVSMSLARSSVTITSPRERGPWPGIGCRVTWSTRASTVTWSPSRSEARSVSSPRV